MTRSKFFTLSTTPLTLHYHVSLQFLLNIDLTLPKAPCAILALDIVDVTGVHEVNYEGRLHKHALDTDGKIKGVTDALRQKTVERSPDVIYGTAKK